MSEIMSLSRSEVLTVLRFQVFWVVMVCSWVYGSWHLKDCSVVPSSALVRLDSLLCRYHDPKNWTTQFHFLEDLAPHTVVSNYYK